MSVVDEYLEDVAAPQRAELERIREIVESTVPDAEEVTREIIELCKARGEAK